MNKDKGTKHFIHQNITSIALIPLVFWLCFSMAFLPETDYQHLIEWIKFPANTLLLIITIGLAFYHAQLGLQMIIEDYISTPSTQLLSISVIKLSCLLLSLIGFYAVLKISLA